MKHYGCGRTIDKVSGTPAIQGKHQRSKCTGTSFMCTGTPCIKSGSGHIVPVQHKCVPVHMCRKLTVVKLYRYITNVYRYIYMEIARFVQELDLYTRALLSTNQNRKITLEGGIKARGHK